MSIEKQSKPLSFACHVLPPSVVLYTPLPCAPAYTVSEARGSMARERISIPAAPWISRLQLDPPSVVLNSPPRVPAQTVPGLVGSATTTGTSRLPSPLLTGSQLRPPSVVFSTPACW